MQFNSMEFLFYFLPVFLACYYLVPARWQGVRQAVLIGGSLLFYSFAGDQPMLTLGVLSAATLLAFFSAKKLALPRQGLRLALVLGLFGAVLVFFKLFAGGRYLPAGMSFYLFQLAAYLIDIYRRRFNAERSLLAFASQITMFPKLLSGPLMEPKDLREQVIFHSFRWENLHRGLQLLILGLGMKVLLANRLGSLWAQTGVIGYESISTPFAWLALIAYAMQLFLDFWGYSLMAMGLGRLLGYHLPENFLDPYAAGSVSGFYRRWHATLGAWFREYVYFPMGGSRKGTLRTFLNLAVVWLFTGLWHGIGGSYLLWAGILLVLIINERLWLGRLLNKTKLLRHVYTVFFILISWLPFAVGDAHQLWVYFLRLFGMGGKAVVSGDVLLHAGDYLPLLLIGAVLATPLPRKLWHKVKDHPVTDCVLFILFWAAVYAIATSAQDPFLYFQY